jgi:membrane fusion protein
MAELLFRQEVIEARRQRLAGTVIAATPPTARLYTLILLVILAAGALFLTFGGYASSAQVRGVVAYQSGIARVYPSAGAEIREIHVRNGQQVEAGAPLVTLALTQGAEGVSAQLTQIANQDAELSRQYELASTIGAAETRALEQQRGTFQSMIGSLDRQRALAAGQIELTQAALRRATRLAGEGAGTQRQVEDSRANLLARRAELESNNERLITQREALRNVEAQLAQRSLETSRTQSVLSAQRAALAEQREQLMRTDRLVLTAPVAGVVSDVAMEVGQRARPERSLVTIVPTGSQLEIWLYAPTRAVGFARPGQQVRLQFDAFPHQKYGAGQGLVTEVSSVPVEAGSIEEELQIQEPVFRVRVRIVSLPPRVADAMQAMRPGMTLTANLVLERRSLWEVLFLPFKSALGS